jgi:hypothetical protein
LHQVVRELFGGKLDTETDSASIPASEEGSRIVIKWAKRGGGRGRGGRGGERGLSFRLPRGRRLLIDMFQEEALVGENTLQEERSPHIFISLFKKPTVTPKMHLGIWLGRFTSMSRICLWLAQRINVG